MEGKHKFTIYVNDEQEEAIRIFFNMNDWELVTEAAVPDGSNDELSRDNNVSSADSTASSISEGLDNNIDSDATTSRSTEPSCSTPNYTNVRNSERSECPYCLLDPCVTSNRQKWLGRGQTARPSNSGIRKLRYQKFWKLLNKRGAWTKTAYLERKTQLMGNANPAIVWTYRDMMPECVLQCVKELYPNPVGKPYIGHHWS